MKSVFTRRILLIVFASPSFERTFGVYCNNLMFIAYTNPVLFCFFVFFPPSCLFVDTQSVWHRSRPEQRAAASHEPVLPD